MRKKISLLFKILRKIKDKSIAFIYNPFATIYFYLNNVNIQNGYKINGFLKLHVTRRGVVNIGKNFRVNSGNNHNIIGRQQKTILWVDGILEIGNDVGISSTAIICKHKIVIGNNVIIGGNTVIYDTDFHSLNTEIRLNKEIDKLNAKWGPVVISDNVFIGAHSTLLKGIFIGKNSVIGACSVVTSNIPDNEIWAGNPAAFIRKVNTLNSKTNTGSLS